MAVATSAPPQGRAFTALASLAEPVLLSYAQLLLSRSRAVGALLLLATLASPRVLLAGLCAVLAATALARVLRFSPEQLRGGAFGYNALLVGLGAGALVPFTPGGVTLALAAVALTVLLAAALHAALSAGPGLPVLTLPFLAAFSALLCAAPQLGAVAHPPAVLDPWAARTALLAPARALLQGLGSLLFLPRVDVGAIVLVALAWHSRIAASLAVLGFGLVAALAGVLPALADGSVGTVLGLNAMLVAMALGGAWFVPGKSAYGLAAGAVVLATAVGLALAPRLRAAGLPVLIVPFNATVLLVLYALRQRIADGAPQTVDFVPGTPEQNLAYFRSRTERFGALYGLRFAAPFRGAWTCSQGVSGAITHKGEWRHALDFEVRDHEGRCHRDTGAQLAEHYCYRLPVVAPAAGVVVRVVDGVPDNAVGAVNLADNWGNAVIVCHAPGVYSCVAHLSPGSIAVREGQHVAAGEVLGLCGNSGRSATPHLHFQLQSTATLGAATIPLRLHDVVVESVDGGRALHAALVPTEGQRVRRLEPDADRARQLRFEYQRPVRIRTTGPRGTLEETVTADLDLLGRWLLRSSETAAVLYFEPGATAFAVHDVLGDPSSALHLVRVALSRVPFDADDALIWTDLLPLRPFLPAWLRPAFDIASPFGVNGSLAMRYAVTRHGRALAVHGESVRRERDGAPWVASTAVVSSAGGLTRLEVRVRGEAFVLEFDPAPAAVGPSVLATSGGAIHVQR